MIITGVDQMLPPAFFDAADGLSDISLFCDGIPGAVNDPVYLAIFHYHFRLHLYCLSVYRTAGVFRPWLFHFYGIVRFFSPFLTEGEGAFQV